MHTLSHFHGRYGRTIWTVLLASGVSAGLAGRAWADDEGEEHEPHRHHDVHVHLPGIHVDVEHGPAVVPAPPPPPPEAIRGTAVPAQTFSSYVVETRGPVHEAFAEPVVYDPEPGITVSKAPPADLDEVPPDQRPEGDNVEWIPGYWAWDSDRGDYIWVSGIWRDIPPDRQFVPGYWAQTDDGQYQWVPGFWQSDQIEQASYLPEPPESEETGPVGEPPQPNYVWVPGVWIWQANNYVWRPGYWMPPQENWVWVPAHYTWAPAGYMFVSGYWDYVTPRRGVLFAPVYVPPGAAGRLVYTPTIVVNASLLATGLFTRPRYEHYYFGDYYDRSYFQAGIYPAYSFQESHLGYSPVLASYIAQQGNRTDVIRRLREDYAFRRDHAEYRPPRTFASLQQLAGRRASDPRMAGLANLVQPFNQYVRQPQAPLRFTNVQRENIKNYRQTIAQTRQFQNQRQRLETQRLRGNVIGPTPPAAQPGARTQINENRRAQINERERQNQVNERERLNQLNERQRQGQLPGPERQAQMNRNVQRQPLNLKMNRSPLTYRSNGVNRSFAPPPQPREAHPNANVHPRARSGAGRVPRE